MAWKQTPSPQEAKGDQVKVSFDGLRRNMASAYNGLTKELNRNIKRDFMNGDEINQMSVSDIADEMENLRMSIGTLLAIYDESGEYKELEIDLIEFAPEPQP